MAEMAAFLKKLWQKIKKCFNYGNLHKHRRLKMLGRQYIFYQRNMVWPKKQVLTLKHQFLP